MRQILGHHSILTTTRYTRLTYHTQDNAKARIDALMDRIAIGWGRIK